MEMDRRKRSRLACVRCKKRKQRCDGNYMAGKDCSKCRKIGIQCAYDTSNSAEYVRLLQEKIESLEKLLRQTTLRKSTRVEGQNVVSQHSLDHSCATESTLFKGGPQNVFNVGEVPFTKDGATSLLFHSWLAELKRETQVDSIDSISAKLLIKRGDISRGPDLRNYVRCLLENDDLCQSYSDKYLEDVHNRYPFLERSFINTLHQERLNLFSLGEGTDCKSDSFTEDSQLVVDQFISLMIYAISARLIWAAKSTRKDANPESEHHHFMFYMYAINLNIERVMVVRNITNIWAMLMLVIYLLRVPSAYTSWHLIGSVMRHCIQLGYHKKDLTLFNDNPFSYLQRNRTFWCVYSLERAISNAFDLPYCLSDEEIDEDLPIDIDENIKDADVIKKQYFTIYPLNNVDKYDTGGYENKPVRTSISLAIQNFHLRRLDSRVQSTFYRINRTFKTVPREEVFALQKEMRRWISEVPDFLTSVEYDYCLYLFNKHIRNLIYPFLTLLDGSDPLFAECVQSAMTVCRLSKRIHHKSKRRPSFVGLQTVFLAGMTLIQAVLARKLAKQIEVIGALKDCEEVLGIMAEQLFISTDFQQIFRCLSQEIMEFHTERSSISNAHLETDLFGQNALKKRQHDLRIEENTTLFYEIHKSAYRSQTGNLMTDFNNILFYDTIQRPF